MGEAEGKIHLEEEFLVVEVGDSCRHGSFVLEAGRQEEEHIAAELRFHLVEEDSTRTLC